MRVEKVTLHHYDPLPGVEIKTGPVLIVYGLVGRYTMADLQEDRSLVRNLLKRGVDLWVVDWGTRRAPTSSCPSTTTSTGSSTTASSTSAGPPASTR